jgi:hypothetical protein
MKIGNRLDGVVDRGQRNVVAVEDVVVAVPSAPLFHGAQPRKAVRTSLGVDYPRHFRGRSLRKVSMRLICARKLLAVVERDAAPGLRGQRLEWGAYLA